MGPRRHVLIRADASPAIGFGHLSRCLALAGALETYEISTVFALQEGSDSAFVRRSGRPVHILPDTGGEALPLLEAAAVRHLAMELKAGSILVDHYAASEDYLGGLRAEGVRVALLDDAYTRSGTHCDLVINPNLDADPSRYRTRPGGWVLAGSAYALLHRAFASQLSGRLGSGSRGSSRVLVVMGAADTARLARRVAAALLEALPERWTIRVVAGPLVTHRSDLEALAGEHVDIVGPLEPSDLAAEMRSAAVGVATPSTVAYEMAASGLPMVLLQTADNQRVTATAFESRGAALVLRHVDEVATAFEGNGSVLDPARRRALAEAASSLVDGGGARRVAERLAEVAG